MSAGTSHGFLGLVWPQSIRPVPMALGGQLDLLGEGQGGVLAYLLWAQLEGTLWTPSEVPPLPRLDSIW